MFCKKCGTEQKNGQKFCPKCGEPFIIENEKPNQEGVKTEEQDIKDQLPSEIDKLSQQEDELVDEKVMYCKKCGTEQKNGQKFCPKCGEPYLDENGKPYLKGFRKDMQDAKEKMASKMGELTLQGKKLVEDKVQPQLNEKVEKLKNVDWKEKKERVSSFISDFIKDTKKIKLVTIIIACLLVFCFFIKVGFSASILWYIIIAAMLYVAFMGIPLIKLEGLKNNYLSICVTFILGFIAIFASSIKNANDKNKGPHEVCITLECKVNHDGDILDVWGSHGGRRNDSYFMTETITIPQGKMWLFKECNGQTSGYNQYYVPDICYYTEGREKGRYKMYNCKNAREVPVFREGDLIKIVANKIIPPRGKEIEQTRLQIKFIEKDDDFSSAPYE